MADGNISLWERRFYCVKLITEKDSDQDFALVSQTDDMSKCDVT